MHSLEVNMVMDLTPLSRQAGRGPSCTVMTHVRPAESTTQQAAYMLVTEIILVKVSRLCQLLSNSRGFPSALIFKSIGTDYGFLSCLESKKQKKYIKTGA